MMNKQFSPKIRHQFQLIFSLIGLTSIAMLNEVEPVQAASLNRIVNFSSSVNINVNFGFSPNNLPDFTAILNGSTRVAVSNPVDAIVNDPLLGNIGSIDGQQDVIQTEMLESINSGSTPFVPLIVARVGDGVPDFNSTPPDATIPYESLYSAGAIIKQSNNPDLAESFFNLSIEIQGTPEGVIRTFSPVTLNGVTPFTGFPGKNTLTFFNTDILPLFSAGADGVFWTGDEVEVARIVPGAEGRSITLNLTSVPEPSNVISLVVIGLGIIWGCRKKIV